MGSPLYPQTRPIAISRVLQAISNQWMNGPTDGPMDRHMDQQTNGRTADQLTNGWTDQWMDQQSGL